MFSYAIRSLRNLALTILLMGALIDPCGGIASASGGSLVRSRADVSRAIDLAVGYLERACGPDGKFVYEVNNNSGRQNESYNIVRHAGAIYALGMYNDAHPDPKVVETMARAVDFTREHYMERGLQANQLIIWSNPLDSASTTQDQYAELGATALGIVAFAELRKAEPSLVPLEQLQSLGRTLLFFQKKDGSFIHKYRPRTGPVQNWHSLYYPGEAALALVYLYEADHSSQWLTAAGKTISHLAKSRVGQTIVPADHWALIATAKFLLHCKKEQCGVPRRELIRHAVQICNVILREQLSGTELDGAFDPTGRTAPVATRLEGLLSALEFLPHDELRQRITRAVERGIAFLLRTQIRYGPNTGGVPGAFPTPDARDASEIRIDYLQHALGAWLRYCQYVSPNCGELNTSN